MDRFEPTPFPTIVAWLSLGLGALLFFGNTVPALREGAQLEATESSLRQLRQQYESILAQAWATTPENGAELDLQSVLVAIDRIGWTPDELLHSYPGLEMAGNDGTGNDEPGNGNGIGER